MEGIKTSEQKKYITLEKLPVRYTTDKGFNEIDWYKALRESKIINFDYHVLIIALKGEIPDGYKKDINEKEEWLKKIGKDLESYKELYNLKFEKDLKNIQIAEGKFVDIYFLHDNERIVINLKKGFKENEG